MEEITLEQAKERIAKLEACLIRVCKLAWTTTIDELHNAESSVANLEWTIKEMEKVGMDAWLPHFKDLQGLLNKSDETIAEESVRRNKAAIKKILDLSGEPPIN